MSGNTPPTQSSAPDSRDLTITEQARTNAELTARVKELEEKLAKLDALSRR